MRHISDKHGIRYYVKQYFMPLAPQEERFMVSADAGRRSPSTHSENGSHKSQRSRKSDAGSQRSSLGSQRSSLGSQRSRDRKSPELALDTSKTTIQDRYVLLIISQQNTKGSSIRSDCEGECEIFL